MSSPTLRRRVKLGTFAALDQRIALRYVPLRAVCQIAQYAALFGIIQRTPPRGSATSP